MIRSMTGFGQGTAESDGVTIWAEISSLNHRHLDMGVKLSPSLSVFESDVRKLLQSRFERGRLNVLLTSEGEMPSMDQIEFNSALARQYLETIRDFAKGLKLDDDLSALSFLRLGSLWTLKAPRAEELAHLWVPVEKALTAAIEQLLEMRNIEGANIWDDLSGRLANIESIAKEIGGHAGAVVDEYRERLKQRIDSILPEGVELDEERLLSEVAVFADKADISEELARLESHIGQFNTLAKQESNIGRRLEFLVQEMFREMTTIGSKARDAGISHSVVEMKGELEKIREQVQNVE